MTSPPESEAAMAEPSEKIRERLARRCVREMRDAVNESGMVTFVRAAIDLAVERAERERDDALFALKETQAAAEARASAEGKWIATSERMPEEGVRVLGYSPNVGAVSLYFHDEDGWNGPDGMVISIQKFWPTHWRELPPLPPAPKASGR